MYLLIVLTCWFCCCTLNGVFHDPNVCLCFVFDLVCFNAVSSLAIIAGFEFLLVDLLIV